MALAVLIILVAALFFFEWLGSEQTQKRVQIEVQPGIKAGSNGESSEN
jgi:hypothetical protein